MPILLKLFNLSRCRLNGKFLRTSSAAARLPNVRSVSLLPLKRTMNEGKFAEKDKVPNGFKIIYRAPMEYYVKAAKIVATSTVAFISGLVLLKIATDNKYITLLGELDFGGLVAHDSDIWWFAAGFIAINGSIMMFITKYPLRIYKFEKKYLAIYEGLLPFSPKRFNFNRGEVKEFKHVLNPWSLITYKIRNKSTLLLLDYFKTPSEFHQMCGEGPLQNESDFE